MSNDPFTLDMFGNTALSSGLGLSVTAFGSFSDPANDDDPEPTPPAPAAALSVSTRKQPPRKQGHRANFYLDVNDRGLAASWKERARMNVAAILTANEIERNNIPVTRAHQQKLIRFTGFGASELANTMFRRPGEVDFREGWDVLGRALETAVPESDYASLARCTQYAHFTPEFIIRAIWSGLQRLGWRGGRVLEPGIGTGLFPALMPEIYRDNSFVTGVELDPVTARIVRLLQPRARIINVDFARTDLSPVFDLAIGNPPFSDRTVRSDRAYRKLGLRLHDYFIARSIDLLKPGALAAFVTSSGTMDKAHATAREHIAKSADLIAAIRLPEGSFRREAGTDVVVDLLFFRKRKAGEAEGDLCWLDLSDVRPAIADEGAIRVNSWFARHPDFVLGDHALTSGPFGETYTCRARPGVDLETALNAAISLLPEDLYDGVPTPIDIDLEDELGDIADLRPDRSKVREGSFFIDNASGLMQLVDGTATAVPVRKGRGGEGIPEKHVRIITKLIPIRDAVRSILKAQEQDRPWRDLQVRLRIAWSSFVRDFGPVNHTTVSVSEDPETGEVRETRRQPNLQPFRDDPDCWLVASIEDYDLETDTARPAPIFTERVISPPAAPVITSAAELIAMFRSFADVVMPDDLRQYVKVPTLSTGRRQILTAKPTAAFKTYQTLLDARIKAIEQREGPAKPGDDILLSVITDGRHAAIDLRLVDPDNDNEPDNKLNLLVENAFRIWKQTWENIYSRPDGKQFDLPGAAQMIFSDLGTINVEKSRGFSAYRWIRDELIRMGVPSTEIAYMQDYKKTEAKQRLFGDVRAGKVRFLIGSSETMGTGVNVQLRLKALHHLDVPWLPSQIEQREGRIVRQGNQHDEVDIFAYATQGSLDASMWQNNECKARFIAAALSGDTSIRRLEDMGEGQANQFAMAKAIASGDERLMQKAGLEADIARLERLRAAHEDDQYAVRRQIRDAERDIDVSTRRITEIGQDIDRLVPTAGDAFTMTVAGKVYDERKIAGRGLMKEILTLLQLQQQGEIGIASIGGFDLIYDGERFGKGDGYRFQTLLQRTSADYDIDLDVTVTPLGAISRLEHALGDFEGEQQRYRRRLEDAEKRLASYRSREGGTFSFAEELADKRRQLREVDETLAAEASQQPTEDVQQAA